MRSTRETIGPGKWARALGLVVLVASLLAIGCKKTPYIQIVRQTPYLGMPFELDHLVCVDARRLLERDAVHQALLRVDQNPKQKQEWDKYRQGLGFDPLVDFDAIYMGARAAGGPASGNPLANTIFIAMGRFDDPEAKLAKLHDLLADQYLIAPPPFKVGQHAAGYKTFSMEAASQYNENLKFSLNFGFPGDDMMVFSFSPALLQQSLDVIAGQAAGLGTNKGWLDMLQRPRLGSIVWGTGNVSPSVSGQIAKNSPDLSLGAVKQYYYSVDVVMRFELVVGLVCGSVENASTLAGQIKQLLQDVPKKMALFSVFMPETIKLPSKVAVLPKDEAVEMLLSLNDDETNALLAEWQRMGDQIGKPNGLFPNLKLNLKFK
jgi:hypothetical protein